MVLIEREVNISVVTFMQSAVKINAQIEHGR